jgi:Rrf2 family protein
LSGVVKFTEASSIALHTMAILAGDPGRHVSIREVAARLPVSEAHLAKVLQRLARAGLVESVRGPGGGFVLRGDPAKLTLLDVHEAIEGRLEVAACLFDPPQRCGACILGDALRDANALVHARLARTRLADLAHLFPPAGARVALGGDAARGRRTAPERGPKRS